MDAVVEADPIAALAAVHAMVEAYLDRLAENLGALFWAHTTKSMEFMLLSAALIGQLELAAHIEREGWR